MSTTVVVQLVFAVLAILCFLADFLGVPRQPTPPFPRAWTSLGLAFLTFALFVPLVVH